MNGFRSGLHLFFEFGKDIFFLPFLAVDILVPLEIRDGNAAGVRQNVGYHRHALLREYGVRFNGRGAVGKIEDDRGFDVRRILFRNRVLQGRRDDDVDGKRQYFFRRNVPPAHGFHGREIAHAADAVAARKLPAPLFAVLDRLQVLDAARYVDAAFRIRERDDGEAGFLQVPREETPDIAEPLYRDRHAARTPALHAQKCIECVPPPESRGFRTALGAARLKGLSCDDCGSIATGTTRIFIAYPVHYLPVGVHIRCRYVERGADDGGQLAGEFAREPLELRLGEFLGVHRDSAFAAAERYVDDGIFHRHPKCKRFHLIHVHFGVVAEASFVRAADVVVLDAEAVKDARTAVVHSYG